MNQCELCSNLQFCSLPIFCSLSKTAFIALSLEITNVLMGTLKCFYHDICMEVVQLR